jgi:hypothetical protein
VADHVPGQRPAAQGNLGLRLLHLAFTKNQQPRLCRLLDGPGWLAFADRLEQHLPEGPPGSRARSGDTRPDGGYVFGDRHAGRMSMLKGDDKGGPRGGLVAAAANAFQLCAKDPAA